MIKRIFKAIKSSFKKVLAKKSKAKRAQNSVGIKKSVSMIAVFHEHLDTFFHEDQDLTLGLLFDTSQQAKELKEKHELACKSMDLIGILRHRALINEHYRSCEIASLC